MAEQAEKKVDHAALAKRAVEEGPTPTVPSTLFFTYSTTGGDTIVAPASSAETYLRKGYTITGEQTIENFTAWLEEQGKKEAPAAAAEPAKAPTTSSKTAT